MNSDSNCSAQMYAEPHTSYQNVTIVGASPISEADLEWACGVTVLVLNSKRRVKRRFFLAIFI
jgi:hypothetical protein